jgi:hypothetical protein
VRVRTPCQRRHYTLLEANGLTANRLGRYGRIASVPPWVGGDPPLVRGPAKPGSTPGLGPPWEAMGAPCPMQQATAKVAAQVGTKPADAPARKRARAFATGRSIYDVPADDM